MSVYIWDYSCNCVVEEGMKSGRIEYQQLSYIREYDFDGRLLKVGDKELDILGRHRPRPFLRVIHNRRSRYQTTEILYRDRT